MTDKKIECTCGSIYTVNNKLRHFETLKHINYDTYINNIITSVDNEWESVKTLQLEIKLQAFIKNYKLNTNIL
jgi:hypothetical protein